MNWLFGTNNDANDGINKTQLRIDTTLDSDKSATYPSVLTTTSNASDDEFISVDTATGECTRVKLNSPNIIKNIGGDDSDSDGQLTAEQIETIELSQKKWERTKRLELERIEKLKLEQEEKAKAEQIRRNNIEETHRKTRNIAEALLNSAMRQAVAQVNQSIEIKRVVDNAVSDMISQAATKATYNREANALAKSVTGSVVVQGMKNVQMKIINKEVSKRFKSSANSIPLYTYEQNNKLGAIYNGILHKTQMLPFNRVFLNYPNTNHTVTPSLPTLKINEKFLSRTVTIISESSFNSNEYSDDFCSNDSSNNSFKFSPRDSVHESTYSPCDSEFSSCSSCSSDISMSPPKYQSYSPCDSVHESIRSPCDSIHESIYSPCNSELSSSSSDISMSPPKNSEYDDNFLTISCEEEQKSMLENEKNIREQIESSTQIYKQKLESIKEKINAANIRFQENIAKRKELEKNILIKNQCSRLIQNIFGVNDIIIDNENLCIQNTYDQLLNATYIQRGLCWSVLSGKCPTVSSFKQNNKIVVKNILSASDKFKFNNDIAIRC